MVFFKKIMFYFQFVVVCVGQHFFVFLCKKTPDGSFCREEELSPKVNVGNDAQQREEDSLRKDLFKEKQNKRIQICQHSFLWSSMQTIEVLISNVTKIQIPIMNTLKVVNLQST